MKHDNLSDFEPLEKAFVEAWTKQIRQGKVLQHILTNDNKPLIVSAKDSIVATRVIQWLGSQHGQIFLRDILIDTGISKKISSYEDLGDECVKRVNLKTQGKQYEFIVTKHFRDKLEKISPCFNFNDIEETLFRSYVIKDRPRNILIILKHDLRKALYLYNRKKSIVIVLEENVVTKEYTIFKTVYSALESDWLQSWLSNHKKKDRICLSEYLKTHSLSINE